MKNFLIIFLGIALAFTLFAQEQENDVDLNIASDTDFVADEDIAWADTDTLPEYPGEDHMPSRERKKYTFPREKFELGFDIAAGFDNNLMSIGEILTDEVVIDLDEWGHKIGPNGFSINLDLISLPDFFINVKNIKIGFGMWNFGLSAGAQGGVTLNVPKDIFTLISEGNAEQRSFSGMISARGGVYAYAGLGASAKYGKLTVGLKPALYTPLVFIPKSGINFDLQTDVKDVEIEGGGHEDLALWLNASGDISVYSPFLTKSGAIDPLKFGFDVSLEGEYELFPFLDVGASFSRIPFAPAKMENRMHLQTTDNVEIRVNPEKLISGDGDDIGFPTDLDELIVDDYDTKPVNVFRFMRFDVYGKYKPFGELLIVKPNLGFSVDINNNEGFFNVGAEVLFNPFKGLLILYLNNSYTESVWAHHLGLVFNARFFELDLGAFLRSEDFAGSFSGQGFGVNVGLRFGW